MITIKPFQGYLPPPELAKIVSSPPYDILSSEEARLFIKNNSNSFLRVIKPESDFAPNHEMDSETLHLHAAMNLETYMRTGRLIQDQQPCFYIYQIAIAGHIQTGIISAVSIRDYNEGLIKKHEHTRPDKEDERTMHIEITNANTGPVFLTFRNDSEFQNKISDVILRKPDIMFQAEDHTNHRLWKITNKRTIDDLIAYFSIIPSLYIADGHHRAASAARVQKIRMVDNSNHHGDEPYNYFMAAIFPHDEVHILGYNRVIKDLGGLTQDRFFKLIQQKFTLKPLSKGAIPVNRHTFTMHFKNKWYELEATNKIISNDSVLRLDASILQNHLLEPVLGIDDPRTNNRIDFVGGIRGLDGLESRCEFDSELAFALYPVSIDELLKVADENKVMPPKSTWFEPKLRSGLIVRSLSKGIYKKMNS